MQAKRGFAQDSSLNIFFTQGMLQIQNGNIHGIDYSLRRNGGSSDGFYNSTVSF